MNKLPQTVRDDTPHDDSDYKRLVRIETKLSKLLEHFGLKADGTPMKPAPTPSTTNSRKEK